MNRVTGFEARLGAIESELDVIDALLLAIRGNVAINTAAIAAINISIAAIEARLDALETTGIVATNVDYQVVKGDRFINCSGSITVTLINIGNADAEITITSTSGTVTLVADAAIQTPSTFTTGTGGTIYPARGQWYQKN